MASLLRDQSLVRRAARLRLTAISLANSMKSGSFRSLYRGQGMEFAGVREYLRGDDVRAIDWNVTARMGKPFVKLFEEERELVVFLVVDCSASMTAGAASRQETAFETGALLALAAEQNGSPVGAALFDGQIRFTLAPKAGRSQVMLLLSRFDNPAGTAARGSALDSALSGAARLLRKRSFVFVISDFRAEGWETPLSVLASRHDVAAIRITSRFDEELPAVGMIPFVDPETGFRQMLPTAQMGFRRKWKEANSRRLDAWYAQCAKNGAFPLIIPAGEDPARQLAAFFASREGA
ncbi:MAG: DUF58 domain-containing protein [Treponema sp.]|jgi:uncharacterized protein (DUF58 family)|nr:DUF58 domain-containing protein [Treponema sp.]